ncbi:hypothetical protein INT45_006600 [Circinella minor]|uniref:Uncharacterized protein n=1 Tax=Circinella minor TaxID=1195481 RepID=A0A8H7SAR1_9FUNG|nr:hypothetical protein INT45_006600 [Circinella minor]
MDRILPDHYSSDQEFVIEMIRYNDALWSHGIYVVVDYQWVGFDLEVVQKPGVCKKWGRKHSIVGVNVEEESPFVKDVVVVVAVGVVETTTDATAMALSTALPRDVVEG